MAVALDSSEHHNATAVPMLLLVMAVLQREQRTFLLPFAVPLHGIAACSKPQAPSHRQHEQQDSDAPARNLPHLLHELPRLPDLAGAIAVCATTSAVQGGSID